MLSVAQQHAAASGADDWKFIVGLATAIVALLALWVTGCRSERARRRELYAGGWAAVQAYKEFAFAVRRRNPKELDAERVRVSEELRGVQKDLAYYTEMIATERFGRVAAEYRSLVTQTREIAGGLIRDGWNAPPITTDPR